MQKRWQCSVCNQIFEGSEPPIPCPVCGAGRDAFVELGSGRNEGFERHTSERFVIIGGGVAAYEAASAIRERNALCSIQMIAKEQVIPYNRPALTDVLASGQGFESIALSPYDEYGRRQIQLITDAFAVGVDRGQRKVALSDGHSLDYDKLLLATGAQPFDPIPRDDDAIPSSTLRTFMDVEAVRRMAQDKRALVVGGGILGIEAALALSELRSMVTVLELGPRILAMQADEAASQRIRQALEQMGITVLTEVSAQRFTLSGATLTDGSQIQADCALVSIGVRSELALARDMGLGCERGILVDAGMRTEDPYIFAAGDCAQFEGRVAGLWSVASMQGRIAGANMAGESLSYSAPVSATALTVGDTSLFSAGTFIGAEHLTNSDEQDGRYRRLYFTDGRLTGAVFIGDVSNSAQALSLIERGANADEAEELVQ